MKRSHCLTALALAGLLLPIALPGFAEIATPPVKVAGCQTIGFDLSEVSAYLGVPFAAPPVGDLRWREPQPVAPWRGVRSAQAFSPACAQTPNWISKPKCEDCLRAYLSGGLPTRYWERARAASVMLRRLGPFIKV